ncbi:acrylate utilization transcriptional regulator AcuR [Neoroseomonas soli]|uniref:TetR family transcriptional regulator n=1 Tax=Neoroseomonas soli TaxID=1081025 RepID=A0A9X9WR19_9PROT|nr:TetR/AcrR family transcriptional regulator [Neoroseomonas soli]MBR0669598.1 TetR family transcriptional regulator [Neoroseomonas soli]
MDATPSAHGPRRRGRPPKDGRAHADTKQRLVQAGVAILTEKGFAAVGLDEILGSVGVPKGSFYYYFTSKDEFGLALIDAYAEYFAAKLDRWLADETRPPLQRLGDFVEDAKAGMARFGFRRGCLVGNLGQEMGVLPELFRARLHGVFLDWQARTARCLEAAKDAGEIAPDEDCATLAAFFWIGWEGAVLRAKLERSPEALDVFARGFFAALRPRLP